MPRSTRRPLRKPAARRAVVARITVDPERMAGVPCIRDLRIPVATVLGMLAQRMTEGEILDAYPDLASDDIRAALEYAARAVEDRAVVAAR